MEKIQRWAQALESESPALTLDLVDSWQQDGATVAVVVFFAYGSFTVSELAQWIGSASERVAGVAVSEIYLELEERITVSVEFRP